MLQRKLLVLSICFLIIVPSTAQQKIVLESIRYSTNIDHFQQVAMQRLFTRNLNSLLLKYLGLPLSDTMRLPLTMIKDPILADQKYDYQHSDTALRHLFIDIVEIHPSAYFTVNSENLDKRDSVIRAEAKTVFYLNAVLADHRNNVFYNEPLYLVVKHNRGPGMGNESSVSAMLPGTFMELMKASLDRLLDPQNDLVQLSIGVSPAFSTDNYLMPLLAGQKRIPVDTAKKILRFNYRNSTQLLRQDEPMYEEIIRRGKKAGKYPQQLVDAIKERPNQDVSDFVFLRQEARDVVNNKNYLLQLVVQIDPQDVSPVPQLVLTGFIPGPFHVFLSDKDTLAVFSISRNVTVNDHKVFPGVLYNGVDSSSRVALNNMLLPATLNTPGQEAYARRTANTVTADKVSWNMIYNYEVKGKIKGRDFTIRCGGFNNRIKEILLDDTLVCIAQGKFTPEVFVVFDASLSPELLNQLLLIGFNRFFE